MNASIDLKITGIDTPALDNRHPDGRPLEWDWLLVCAVGHTIGSWLECSGHLQRQSEEMGARLLCETHR